MNRLLARYADGMDRFSVFLGQACATLFFACIVISALEVVMRYGLNRPTSWSVEIAMTLCAAAWVLSVGWVTERHRHISITMVEMLVSPGTWRLFRLIQMIVAFVAVALLTFALWDPAMKAIARMEHSGSAFNSIQPVFLKVLIVVGCVLYLLQLLANIIRWVQHTEKDIGGGH